MALILEANYSKKLGLPGYSSHQYSVTVRTELSDVSQVEAESRRLYGLLQGCVDRDIQNPGFLPGHASNGNGHSHAPITNGAVDEWKCSPKQKELILKLVEDRRLSKTDVEQLSQQLFGAGVRSLNKLQASGLISELTAEEPQSQPPRGSRNGHLPARGGRR